MSTLNIYQLSLKDGNKGHFIKIKPQTKHLTAFFNFWIVAKWPSKIVYGKTFFSYYKSDSKGEQRASSSSSEKDQA